MFLYYVVNFRVFGWGNILYWGVFFLNDVCWGGGDGVVFVWGLLGFDGVL